MEDINKEFEHLLKEIDEKGYTDYSYEATAKIEIEGVLLAKIIAYNAAHRKLLAEYERLAEKTSEMLDFNDQLTLDLMRKHIDNCQTGKAKKQEKK